MFTGNIAGTIGEVSVIALLLGAAYMLVKKVITIRIPAAYIITFVIFIVLFGGHGLDFNFIAAHLCGGGLIFGAFFMATDYVTSPHHPPEDRLPSACSWACSPDCSVSSAAPRRACPTPSSSATSWFR